MDEEKGWIKLHRKFLAWEWYTDEKTKSVFLHLLLNANIKPIKWKGIQLERGELIRTLPTLSEELNMSVQEIRTAISHLKSTGEITDRLTGKIRVLKVCNYGIYQESNGDYQQDNQQDNQQPINRISTECQQDSNRISTADKEIKNNKNIRNKELKKKDIKDIYGEYQHVMLTEAERDRLFNDYGEAETLEAIKYLDEYLESHQKKIKEYTNHNLVLRNWVFNAVKERKQREERSSGFSRQQQTEDNFFSGLKDWAKNYGGEELNGQGTIFGDGGNS